MNGKLRAGVVVVGALLLCALVWWQLRAPARKEATPPAPPAQPAEVVPQPPEHAAPTADAHAAPPSEKGKQPAKAADPQAPSTRIDLAPPRTAPHDSPITVPLPNTMLRDRRPNPGPHAQSERISVGYALDTLDDDIEACLAEWRKTQVSLQGSLMLSIEIDAKGVQKAWVDSDAGIPLGPQSCFSNAVYGIDWSHMVDSPAKITRPYAFDKDGGT